MKTNDKDQGRNGTPVEIKPVSFRPGRRHRSLKSISYSKWVIGTTIALILILLCASVWFVFTARQVIIRIEPVPERISIRGGIAAPKFGNHFLLRPGEYRLVAEQPCFRTLAEDFAVTHEKSQELAFTMTKLPGLLSFRAHRLDKPSTSLEGARIFIDGRRVGQTPTADLEVLPGQRTVVARADHYLDLQTELEVQGCGAHQTLDLALVPGWSDITIDSVPRGARLLVDGKPAGATPLTVELAAGRHELVLTAKSFKPWRSQMAVKANQPRKLDIVQLQPADGVLTVRTNPAGANVMVGSSFAGQTPLELNLKADTRHIIHIYKAGYEKADRRVRLNSEESKTVSLKLIPKLGVIDFAVDPPDAEIFVDRKSIGSAPGQIKLVAVEHQLEARRKGYRPYRTRFTPRPGFPQEIRIVLTRLPPGQKRPGMIIQAKNGYELKLVQPSGFTMGSSRREQGRRSNETLRNIDLKRPFYMGVREVTHEEFRQFSGGHQSGTFKGQSLNRPELPVAGVTWEQAALFCNWLSARDGLPPVYTVRAGKLAAANPVGTGYRLPTEAEWEYCARFNNNQAHLKYPWGNKFPPPPRSGNFADLSARDLLATVLEAYNDGYPVMAPAAKFKPNPLGLFDLGGNAAEWCHDYYSIYSYDSKKVYRDPTGPEEGKHHIIRGSTWRQSGISELRSSYRDYSDGKRVDLGFRVGRYLE